MVIQSECTFWHFLSLSFIPGRTGFDPNRKTMLFLATVEEEGRAGEGRREMAETLLSALTDRHQQRQTWRD
ncbi:alpha-ketoglutarate-dependent dioxygenase FTO, partial [Lates japonicus]